MSDGLPMPTCHDGTGYFSGGRDKVWIARNQEGFQLGRAHGPVNAYDPYAQGGVTVTHFNTKTGKVLGNALVLNGTDNNCNGGATPWGTWLTGEENTVGSRAGLRRRARLRLRGRRPRDLARSSRCRSRTMGRFVHEACPVDPKTGIVYMTEDNGDPGDGFYRYLPDHKGKLHRGGKLQMLAIKGRPKYNTVDEPDRRREARVPLGRRSRTPIPTAPTASRRPSTCRAARRAARGSSASRAAPSRRAAATSRPPTAATRSRGRSGSTRRTTRTSSAARLSSSTSRASTGCSPAPTRSRRARAAAILVCEDGSSEDVPGQPSRMKYISPNGELHDFARVTEPMQLHDHIAADLFPYNPDRWDNPPEEGEGVGRSEVAGRRLQPRRQVALLPHPVSGRELRDHRAVAQGLAVRRSVAKRAGAVSRR